MFERKKTAHSGTIIKVIGVGGAGGNAVNHMESSGLPDIEFICANTDAQALTSTGAATRIQLGQSGLGAGSDPIVGRESAIRERPRIADALKGAHMVFITAGMGGGTGTGAAPVVAEVARELGILTVGVVSKPFEFEGARRMRVAEEGIRILSKSVDSLVIVLNSRLEEVLGDDITQKQAFRAADDVLARAVAGIADIIKTPGMINVDFEDVRTVMRQTGTAMMGTAIHSGENRAIDAAQEAMACPLLDGTNLQGARGLLVNIAASEETLKLRETKQVMNLICAQTSEDAIIKFGAVFDDSLGDAMRVTVVATGLSLPTEAAPGGVRGQAAGVAEPEQSAPVGDADAEYLFTPLVVDSGN
ncbi:MAG TPA: cell division protein FtsZ [Burkholderiales bacterium]|nr:cell division protein FtsZ [Burkholderiales bacterium]